MKDIGKISIVMPCWKAENYISDIVNDVTKQTYDNWELIIVSNGSGQAPQLEVIRPFLSADNRLRVISTEIPGVSNARNLGMASATGDWLTFVDADDRIKDCYLESLAEGTTDAVDIVIGGYTAHLVESNSYSNIQASKVSGIDKNFIEMFDMIKKVAWGKLFRTSMLHKWGGVFDDHLTISEDAVFCYSLYCYTQNIVSIPLTGYIYNFGNPGSALSKFHECSELAESILCDYERKMIDMVDADNEWKNMNYTRVRYMSAYFTICNFFKGSNILSYRILKKRIKRTVNNSDVKAAVIARNGSPCNINLKIFNFCVLHNTPYTLYLIFTARKLWKKYSKKG